MKYFGNRTHLSLSKQASNANASASRPKEKSTMQAKKIGVLLVNLGTPEQAKTGALRNYLAEFLMDPRVIELPSLLRFLLVRGLIVNFRSAKSAASYAKIWTDAGSPLLVHSQALCDGLSQYLGDRYATRLAMRYGRPCIDEQLKILHQQGVHELLVIPLYPQYSSSTTGSVFDAIAKSLSKFRWVPRLRFIDSYFQQPLYINAIVDSIRRHWADNGRAEKLILSFHGLPEKMVANGDPYQQQCVISANEIAKQLELSSDQWMMVFQSRFGAQKWLQPYCDKTLEALPASGVKSVELICPGFSVDCLETLMEINMENREIFINAGGKQFSYIPCLNDSPINIELLATLVQNNV